MSEGFPTETQASPSAPEPQPKKGKGLGRVVLIVLVLVGLCSTCCCLSCGGLIWMGFGEFANQAKAKYENDPVVIDRLGGIDSCGWNVIATGEESEQNSGNTFVFDVEGPKGRGQLIIVSSTQDLENVESAVLRQGGVDYPLSDYLLDFESLPQ